MKSQSKPKDSSDTDKLMKSFGVDVSILAKYHPIEEVGLRAFDNNQRGIENYAQSLLTAKLSELLERLPEANPKEWADNLPQIAWTVGFDKAITEVRTVIEEMMEGRNN